MTARSPVPARRTRARRRVAARALLLPALLVALATPASGQLISIKTVPVAQADQFDLFPSQNLGMAGVSIAVADPLLDPFVNPAKGARLQGTQFFGSPMFYSVSRRSGGGRTLPLGALARSRAWFGGVALAVQEVDAARRNVPPIFFPLVDPVATSVVPPQQQVFPPEERTHGNRFAFGMLGKAFPDSRLSFGGSVLWAGLEAIDGVDLLYANSQRIDQVGDALDIRVGVLKEWGAERSLEALLIHNRLDMTHDVTYADWFWDPTLRQTVPRPRLEHNVDRTNTWGLHLEYERPLTSSGWRVGGLLTGNLMSHPKIPNYEIMNIPRDPGRSQAYNFGVGFSKAQGPSTFAVDAVYEPIWSYTWADAAAPVQTTSGGTIPAGGKTVENHFRFSNSSLRLGFNRELATATRERAGTLQFGLALRSIHYWLEQQNNVQAFTRGLEERWREWTYTWGASVNFPEVEIRYRGRLTTGTGRPGVAQSGVTLERVASGAASNILVAPSGPLTLDDVSVVTHQFSVSLPLR